MTSTAAIPEMIMHPPPGGEAVKKPPSPVLSPLNAFVEEKPKPVDEAKGEKKENEKPASDKQKCPFDIMGCQFAV